MEPITTEIVVLGAGPGGYTAAFAAADRGKKVVMVEQDKSLGGVCLNRGCIPSKALLSATGLIVAAKESAHRGIAFEAPKIDLAKLRNWKGSVVGKLAGGIAALAKARGVHVVAGRGYFEGSNQLRVETEKGQQLVQFEQAIIATGSQPAMPKAFDLGNPRIMTSTEALQIEEIPADILVVGGGYIGMELGAVYANLGSKVVVVEALGSVLTGADPDLVRPVVKRATRAFKEIRLKTKVSKLATKGKKILVVTECGGKTKEELYDRVLVAIGRAPNCDDLGIENTKVERDDRGFIKVDDHQQTGDPSIYAIGDIVGGALLAHKAFKEAKVAVESILGEEASSTGVVIPAVVFTDPELAWCGLTETEARAKNIEVKVSKFPWSASGRALTHDRDEGLTKMILEPETERILGVGIVGHGAGELIAEGVLAIEMGATARDIAESVHPHPTLSETVMESAEAFLGTATHMLSPAASAE
jgi:dihydrolipoamide dehydrogenase